MIMTSQKVIIENDEIAHVFDGKLSIGLQKIFNEDHKEILLVSILSPGKNIRKEKITEVGACISYLGYSIDVLSILKDKAEFRITSNNSCGDSPH